MKVLILNSGFGSRMDSLTLEHPKCTTEISSYGYDIVPPAKTIKECWN